MKLLDFGIAKLLNGRSANGGPQKLAKGTKIDKAYLASVEKYHWFDVRPAEDELPSCLGGTQLVERDVVLRVVSELEAAVAKE